MGGIINAFTGGMGDAAKVLGLEAFRADLANERDEANGLRQRTLQGEDHKFKASQGAMDRASKEKIADMRPKKNPQLIKYTDAKGYEQEGVLQPNKDGSFTIVHPKTGEVIEKDISREELKNKAAQMNVESGRGSDWIPFNEFSQSDPEVRAAVSEEKKSGSGKGIIDSQTEPPAAKQKTVGSSPHPEGTKLKGKDGKTYVVKNGKPVLEES